MAYDTATMVTTAGPVIVASIYAAIAYGTYFVQKFLEELVKEFFREHSLTITRAIIRFACVILPPDRRAQIQNSLVADLEQIHSPYHRIFNTVIFVVPLYIFPQAIRGWTKLLFRAVAALWAFGTRHRTIRLILLVLLTLVVLVASHSQTSRLWDIPLVIDTCGLGRSDCGISI